MGTFRDIQHRMLHTVDEHWRYPPAIQALGGLSPPTHSPELQSVSIHGTAGVNRNTSILIKQEQYFALHHYEQEEILSKEHLTSLKVTHKLVGKGPFERRALNPIMHSASRTLIIRQMGSLTHRCKLHLSLLFFFSGLIFSVGKYVSSQYMCYSWGWKMGTCLHTCFFFAIFMWSCLHNYRQASGAP